MPLSSNVVIPTHARPGTIVSCQALPFFRHKGLVSDRFFDGKPMVLSNSARSGCVAEEPWGVFAAQQSVEVDGYPSHFDPRAVLQIARSKIGTKYDLLSWNCEHFVTFAHGCRPHSSQLALVTVLALIAGLAVISAN